MKLNAHTIKSNWTNWSEVQIANFITRADQLYWEEAKPEISDALFDQLVNRLGEIAPNHKLLKNVGLRLANWGSPITHEHPMLSLEKCKTIDELLHWAKKKGNYFTITPKVDGVAISLHYNNGKFLRAATRGDGHIGEDISTPVRRVLNIPMQIKLKKPIEIRGELYFPRDVFPQYSDMYVSPRNAVAGCLKNQKLNEILPLHLYPYSIFPDLEADHVATLNLLHSLGFSCDYRWSGSDLKTIFDNQRFQKINTQWPFETDGVVVRVNNHRKFIELGTTAHHPRGTIAFKFADTVVLTQLKEVVWETSRTGIITPVAIFDPVNVAGASLSRATLHNLGRFRALQLEAECTLEITRRGGVIPQVENAIVGPAGRHVRTFKPPTKCPSCGMSTIEESHYDGVFLICASNSCPAQKINQLIHYAKTIGMKGFGPKVVEVLFEEKQLNDFSDFYNGSSNFWGEFIGPGVTANLEKEVQSHLKIPLATFLAALGIPSLGAQTARIIATKFKCLEHILIASIDDLQDLSGIGDVTGGEIHEGLLNLEQEIRFLYKYLNILTVRSHKLGWKGPQHPLRGRNVCFTGSVHEYSKRELALLAVNKGANIFNSVTKELNILIEADPSTNSLKSLKALKLKVEGYAISIIPISKFFEIVGVNHVP